ncbi:hypothetical protein SLEP1_g12584 [Rubroshorea leprosula]|uniref:Uncharacterized protein n=1 Tax=Rubroshorea leprosula TaxID=152421 RepID=A0AAV5IMF3_9ROSI|nr:hypothetical protein SLEP1_g12584 [Rubroshorea leprosula]
MRARVRKMRKALNGLIEQIWVDNNMQQGVTSTDFIPLVLVAS